MSREKVKTLKRKSKFASIIYNHINNNKREYLIIIILFFIGIIAGVIFINNTSNNQIEEINTYLRQLFNNIKTSNNIDFSLLFKQSILTNLIMILVLWFGASTIIGIPVVYGTIIIKGFTFSYTISSIINSFGLGNGILITFSLLLLHNILLIPTIFATSVSGIKLYKSIMKNRNRENIKTEILRHTIFCVIMFAFMMVSSIVEVYISTNIFIFLFKYIKI